MQLVTDVDGEKIDVVKIYLQIILNENTKFSAIRFLFISSALHVSML